MTAILGAVDIEYVRIAMSPEGKRFMVVIAPPGSALDAVEPRGAWPSLFINVVSQLVRSARGGWRIAVTPVNASGDARGRTFREQVEDQTAAEKFSAAVLNDISAGRWPRQRSE